MAIFVVNCSEEDPTWCKRQPESHSCIFVFLAQTNHILRSCLFVAVVSCNSLFSRVFSYLHVDFSFVLDGPIEPT